MFEKNRICGFFGIRIDGIDADEVVHCIESNATRPFWIVTANPEILICAKREPTYASTLKHADLRIADGVGLTLMGRLQGKRLIRVTGVDLAEHIVRWAAKNGLPVALIGGRAPDVAQKALIALQAKIPGLRGMTEPGGRISNNGEGDETNDDAIMRLAMQDPAVILVAFGHPKQERWVERCRDYFPNARVIMGVGGSFDYWSGLLPRAPQWIRAIGLEWIYRLFTEPKRWKRIWNAVIVFPIAVLISQSKNADR